LQKQLFIFLITRVPGFSRNQFAGFPRVDGDFENIMVRFLCKTWIADCCSIFSLAASLPSSNAVQVGPRTGSNSKIQSRFEVRTVFFSIGFPEFAG